MLIGSPCNLTPWLMRWVLVALSVFMASASPLWAQSGDSEVPAIALQNPAADNATIAGEFTFSGPVSDTGGSGLREVRYLLRDLNSLDFVSPQGTSESPRVLRAANLDLANPNSGTWSVPVSLPEGRYRLYVRVRDRAGNSLVWAIRTTFTVEEGSPVVDETAPTLSLVQPAAGVDVLDDSEQVFIGQSSDGGGSGVERVFYVVRDLDTSDFVDNRGRPESVRVLRNAALAQAANGSTRWTVNLGLPAGRYRFYASAVDGAGNITWWGVRRSFTVTEDTTPPGNSVFVPDPSDIVDPYAFYQQDGYDTVNVLRMDVATRTTPGTCTVDDDSGCTLADVLADVDGDDDFTVDIPVKFSASDFPDDGLNSNAGLRQRGATSRAAPQKSFRVRLTNEAGLWRNEQRVQLNKHPYDQSRILNKLSFDLMAQLPHLPSLRTQFVNLWIDDGEGPVNNGLYTHVEAVKKEYLENRGRDRDDNIYKANFFLFSPSDLALMAVDSNGEPIDEDAFESRLEIERGDDHSTVVEMLTAFNDPQQSMDEVLDRYFNRNNVLMWLTVNLLLGQQDAVSQNYFLYNPLGTEKFYFLPWDYDAAFRDERQLSATLDASQLRERLYWGYARYADNLFISEFLRLPGMHDLLVAAATEVRRDYLTDGAIRSLTDTYIPQVRSLISSEPDISQIGGIRRPERMNVWDARVASLPSIVASNMQMIERSPNMPFPPYLKAPYTNSSGDIVLWWEPAFEVTGTAVSYDLQVSSTPEFSAGTVAYQTSGIPDDPSRVEFAVDRSELSSGTWYYRIFARTTDPVIFQSARNRLSENGQLYLGVRRFTVP